MNTLKSTYNEQNLQPTMVVMKPIPRPSIGHFWKSSHLVFIIPPCTDATFHPLHQSQHGSKGAESTKNNINMYRFTREMVQDGYSKETKTKPNKDQWWMLDDCKLSFHKRTGSPDSLIPLMKFNLHLFQVWSCASVETDKEPPLCRGQRPWYTVREINSYVSHPIFNRCNREACFWDMSGIRQALMSKRSMCLFSVPIALNWIF